MDLTTLGSRPARPLRGGPCGGSPRRADWTGSTMTTIPTPETPVRDSPTWTGEAAGYDAWSDTPGQ